MAMQVSFWRDLPRPYRALATVYIASQPLSGATRSKAVDRSAGAVLGAATAIIACCAFCVLTGWRDGLAALIDEDSIHVDGYFEETKLSLIHVGDRAAIHLLGETRDLHGRVEGVKGGIEDRGRSNDASLLANVNHTFNWVRLAQLIPVRIVLDGTPSDIRLVAGRTATPDMENGAAPCARGPESRRRRRYNLIRRRSRKIDLPSLESRQYNAR